MFQNQNAANNGVGGMDPAQQLLQQQQQQNINYNGMQQQQQHPETQQQQQQQPSRNVRKKQPYVKITEQPAGKALRFRYECEGRSAGSIPGVNSTPENKTFPTIEIVGYKGRAVVVVSCVTKDSPHRPHPHNLVGKEGCKKGVCTLEINSETMRAVFSNLGIQCVKKKDIESALKAREEIRVDPFKTGFNHRYTPSSIDLNSVRLCFQVFMESEQKGRFTQPLPPVVSEPIFDKKAMSDLVICRLCSCSASVLGNNQIILLCEKVAKEDIAVRFFEEKNGQVVWEAFGEFQHTDVHKQTAIAFKTPRYHTLDITEPAKVFIQLRRPSDGVTSESLPFEYVPLDSGRPTFWNLRRNLKRKPDLDIFQQILSVDSGGVATKIAAEPVESTEVIDLNTPTTEQHDFSTPIAATAPTPVIAEPTQQQHQDAEEAAKRRSEQEIDIIIDEKVRELGQQRQQIAPIEPDKQTVETIDESRPLTTTDKINEWMKSNEFGQQQIINEAAASENSVNLKSPPVVDEDKTLNDLLDQVAELDEIYTDHVLRRDNYNSTLINELHGIDVSMPDSTSNDGGEPTAMEIDENFDDTATYTSLQIAFKNPISLPMPLDIMPPTPPLSHLAAEDTQHYDPIEVQANSNITQSPQKSLTQQTPTRIAAATPNSIISPHMHVTAAEEEKRPPLPPKRVRKQDANVENRSIEANLAGSSSNTLERKPVGHSQIIIMRTPDQSPPTKRLPPTPGGGNGSNCNTLPKQKKPGFFSKLFSRRKSKSDLCQAQSEQQLQHGFKSTSVSGISTPNSDHFSKNDSNRNSIRSAKSLQPMGTGSGGSSPSKRSPGKKIPKTGKPVGRSVSSVSDPAHLRRKRQKTGGDPMHLLLQQQQKQQHPNDHQDGRQATNINCWNAPNIPAIKTEPRDTSPQPFNMYRAPPELTPSPQPHSPSNNYNNHNNTPSPYSMGNTAIAVATVGGGHTTNPHLMSPNHHYATAGGGVGGVGGVVGGVGVITNGPAVGVIPTGAGTPMEMQDYGAFGQHQQQQHAAAHHQHYQGNHFGGTGTTHNWEEKYAASNVNNNNNIGNLNNNTNPFTMHNLLTPAGSGNGVPGVGSGAHPHWNLAANHMHNPHQQQQMQQQQQLQQHQQQQQHQYQQQTSTETANVAAAINNIAVDVGNNNNNNNNNDQHGPTLSNLLSFDSEQLVRINSEDQQMLRLNSEDLQISNLSIST